MLVNVFTLHAHADMNTRALILPNALGTVLCLGMTALLVPGSGLEVAPLAVAAGGACVVGWIMFARRGQTGSTGIEWKSICLTLLFSGAAVLFVRQLTDLFGPGVAVMWQRFGVLMLVGVIWAWPMLRAARRS